MRKRPTPPLPPLIQIEVHARRNGCEADVTVSPSQLHARVGETLQWKLVSKGKGNSKGKGKFEIDSSGHRGDLFGGALKKHKFRIPKGKWGPYQYAVRGTVGRVGFGINNSPEIIIQK